MILGIGEALDIPSLKPGLKARAREFWKQLKKEIDEGIDFNIEAIKELAGSFSKYKSLISGTWENSKEKYRAIKNRLPVGVRYAMPITIPLLPLFMLFSAGCTYTGTDLDKEKDRRCTNYSIEASRAELATMFGLDSSKAYVMVIKGFEDRFAEGDSIKVSPDDADTLIFTGNLDSLQAASLENMLFYSERDFNANVTIKGINAQPRTVQWGNAQQKRHGPIKAREIYLVVDPDSLSGEDLTIFRTDSAAYMNHLRDNAINHLVSTYLDGNSVLFDTNVEEMALDSTARSMILSFPKERDYYRHIAMNKNFFLVTDTEGKIHTAAYKNGKPFFTRVIDENQAALIRRLYKPTEHIEGFTWNPEYDFDTSITFEDINLARILNEKLPDELRLDKKSMKTVKKNLRKAKKNAGSFLQALELLSRQGQYAEEMVFAGLSYLSKTHFPRMGFAEEIQEDTTESYEMTVADIDVMTRTMFFENIAYKVPLLHENPLWREHISDDPLLLKYPVLNEKFLNDVLSIRESEEPMHESVVRLAIEATQPFMQDFSSRDEARDLLNRTAKAISNFKIIRAEDQSFYLMLASNEIRCEEQTSLLSMLAKHYGDKFFKLSIRAWGIKGGNHAFGGEFIETEAGDTLCTFMPCDPNAADPFRYNNEVFAVLWKENPLHDSVRFENVTRYVSPVMDITIDVPVSAPEVFINTFMWGYPMSHMGVPTDIGRKLDKRKGLVGFLYDIGTAQEKAMMQHIANKLSLTTTATFKDIGIDSLLYFFSSDKRRAWYTKGPVKEVGPPVLADPDGSLTPLHNDSIAIFNADSAAYDIYRNSVRNFGTWPQEKGNMIYVWFNGEWHDYKAVDAAKDDKGDFYLPGVVLHDRTIYKVIPPGQYPSQPIIAVDGKLMSR